MSKVGGIQWKRGFIRLWVLFALLWVLGTLLILEPWQQIGNYSKAKENLEKVRSIYTKIDADIEKGGRTLDDGTFIDVARLTKLRETVQEKQSENETTVANFRALLVNDVLLLLGGPAVVLALGAAVGWVVGGFRRSTQSHK